MVLVELAVILVAFVVIGIVLAELLVWPVYVVVPKNADELLVCGCF
jgi:hypothetical protein